MSRYHEFDSGYTGMSDSCNELILDEGGYGVDCGLPRDHHIHYVPRHLHVYDKKRDEFPRNNRAVCECWERQTSIVDPCPKSEMYFGRHRRNYN